MLIHHATQSCVAHSYPIKEVIDLVYECCINTGHEAHVKIDNKKVNL